MKLHMRSSWQTGRTQCGRQCNAEWKVSPIVFGVIGLNAVRPRAVLCRWCIACFNRMQSNDIARICP